MAKKVTKKPKWVVKPADPVVAATLSRSMHLDEDWRVLMNMWRRSLRLREVPEFFRHISDFDNFERRFESAVRLGCRADVLLFALQLFSSYGRESVNRIQYDGEGEVERIAAVATDAVRGGDQAARDKCRRALDSALAELSRQSGTIRDLAISRKSPVVLIGLEEVQFSAEDALEAATTLLRWAAKLMERGPGSLASVRNADRVIPAAYVVDVVHPKKSPYQVLSDLLASVAREPQLERKDGSAHLSAESLRGALTRFRVQYPRQHEKLTANFAVLQNNGPDIKREKWLKIFGAEAQRRRSERRSKP